MSRAARMTVSGVMWLAAPRSSAAPQRDGHRFSGGRGRQSCAGALAAESSTSPIPMTTIRHPLVAVLIADLHHHRTVSLLRGAECIATRAAQVAFLDTGRRPALT